MSSIYEELFGSFSRKKNMQTSKQHEPISSIELLKYRKRKTNEQTNKQRDQHLIFANKRGAQPTDNTTKLWFPTTIQEFMYPVNIVIGTKVTLNI